MPDTNQTPIISKSIHSKVEDAITIYDKSRLAKLVSSAGGTYAIKFVNSKWAEKYKTPAPLNISTNALLTWGTATYVTPLAFPLSSALYGRVGLVTDYDPAGWRIFDATDPMVRATYIEWVRVQPAFSELLLTVHSTHANRSLRNKFKEDFKIDCVLFNPDQEADLHTDIGQHVWMAVTDWRNDKVAWGDSGRLARARFTVLIDEEFALEDNGLPIHRAARQIEKVTETIPLHQGLEVTSARVNPRLHADIISHYLNGGYVHVYIKP